MNWVVWFRACGFGYVSLYVCFMCIFERIALGIYLCAYALSICLWAYGFGRMNVAYGFGRMDFGLCSWPRRI